MKPTIDMMVSPYDRSPSPAGEASLIQLNYRPAQRLVPSHYNARATGDDGRLILWNTLSGAISVFSPEDRESILASLSARGVRAPLDRYGRYLSKRGFLVEEGTRELDLFRYRFAREQYRNDLLELILLSSEDCNFRCKYCYEKFKNGTMSPDVRQGVRAMVLSRAPYLRGLVAGWFGGEPLYGWEAIEELSPFFKDVAERHGIAHVQNMTTNGYLLTEERATKLLDWGCRQYQITVDGLPEEHDCKRVGRDGSPTYQVILDNLRSLKQRDDVFLVNLRVNFDHENLPRLGAFLEALSEDFAGDRRFRMRFRAVGRWGGANDENLDTCGIREEAVAMHELRSKAADLNLHQETPGIRGITAFGSQVCYAARPYSFIVGATGKLMKCTVALDELPENVVGRIHPDGTMELVDEHMIRWVNPHFETDSLCQKCHVLPICQGSMCPLPRITRNTRQCCHVKSHLKNELRATLAESAKPREVAATT